MSARRVSEVGLLRLVALSLVGSREDDVAGVVRHLGAVQAQDLPGMLTSLALRTAGRSREAVVAACDAGEIVRSWPMRGTLHCVPAEDLGWMLALGTPRPQVQAARRRVELELTDADVERAGELALAAVPATREALFAVWDEAGLRPVKGRGYHLLATLASRGVVCFGPFDERGDPLVVDVARWIPSPWRPERDEALGEWARRYFRSHGPATRTDLLRWTGIAAADVDTGIALARPDLASLDVDGTEYLLDPAVPDVLAEHRRRALGVHLLPGFDEFVLGYGRRDDVLEPAYGDRIVPGGNGVFRSTIVHRGRIVGTWAVPRRRLEVSPFGPLDAGTEAAVTRAHARLP